MSCRTSRLGQKIGMVLNGGLATVFASVFACDLTWWFLSLLLPLELLRYSDTHDWVLHCKSLSIMFIGSSILCLSLNSFIRKVVVCFPAKIGLQSDAMLYHLTATTFEPKLQHRLLDLWFCLDCYEKVLIFCLKQSFFCELSFLCFLWTVHIHCSSCICHDSC